MFYERKIKYLDCMQNGERKSGAGFVKIEVREKNCNLMIQVNVPGRMNTGDREVLCLGEKTQGCLGMIHLEQGKGNLELNGLNAEEMGRSGISYGELRGIRIPLDGGMEAFCKWRESMQGSERQMQNTEERVRNMDVPTLRAPSAGQDAEAVRENTEAFIRKEERMPKKDWGRAKETISWEPKEWEKKMGEPGSAKTVESDWETKTPDSQTKATAQDTKAVDSNIRTADTDTEAVGSNTKTADTNTRAVDSNTKTADTDTRALGKSPEKPSLPIRQPIKLRESKWQQIASIYPHIKPFRDEREYISIGPGDFVILPEKYYRMANNSFLLHGYHNYEHLILTKVERRGEVIYYIGVPGTYYEREKQVAVMFGFESFECMEEPARQGDFGYYMMRLEL